jgi:hypothetical protein
MGVGRGRLDCTVWGRAGRKPLITLYKTLRRQGRPIGPAATSGSGVAVKLMASFVWPNLAGGQLRTPPCAISRCFASASCRAVSVSAAIAAFSGTKPGARLLFDFSTDSSMTRQRERKYQEAVSALKRERRIVPVWPDNPCTQNRGYLQRPASPRFAGRRFARSVHRTDSRAVRGIWRIHVLVICSRTTEAFITMAVVSVDPFARAQSRTQAQDMRRPPHDVDLCVGSCRVLC